MKCMLFLMMIGVSASSATEIALMPQNWNPDVDIQTVSEWGEETLKGPTGDMPQQGLSRYLAILVELWDSKLMVTYVKLSSRLVSPDKESLLKEQQLWLTKRETESKAAESSESGGSGAPATYSQVYIELTKERIKELSDRIAGQPLQPR